MSKKFVVSINTDIKDIFANLSWSRHNNINMIIKQHGSTTRYMFESKESAIEFKLSKL